MSLKPEATIAVGGHRLIKHPERLETEARKAAQRITEQFPGHAYRVITCLAEGADHLLARVLLAELTATLSVVLPLRQEEFSKDFTSQAARMEFERLLQTAQDVFIPDQAAERPHAYRDANRTLLQYADLLLAIWDGKPARGIGGTGELVSWARNAGLPTLLIHPDGITHPGDNG